MERIRDHCARNVTAKDKSTPSCLSQALRRYERILQDSEFILCRIIEPVRLMWYARERTCRYVLFVEGLSFLLCRIEKTKDTSISDRLQSSFPKAFLFLLYLHPSLLLVLASSRSFRYHYSVSQFYSSISPFLRSCTTTSVAVSSIQR